MKLAVVVAVAAGDIGVHVWVGIVDWKASGVTDNTRIAKAFDLFLWDLYVADGPGLWELRELTAVSALIR